MQNSERRKRVTKWKRRSGRQRRIYYSRLVRLFTSVTELSLIKWFSRKVDYPLNQPQIHALLMTRTFLIKRKIILGQNRSMYMNFFLLKDRDFKFKFTRNHSKLKVMSIGLKKSLNCLFFSFVSGQQSIILKRRLSTNLVITWLRTLMNARNNHQEFPSYNKYYQCWRGRERERENR